MQSILIALLITCFVLPVDVHAANNINSKIVFFENFEKAETGKYLRGWSGNISIREDETSKVAYTSSEATSGYVFTPYIAVDPKANYLATINMKIKIRSGVLTLRYACYNNARKVIYANQHFFKDISTSYDQYTNIEFYLPVNRINPETNFIRLCLWWNKRPRGEAFINSIKVVKLGRGEKYLKKYSKNSGDWFEFCIGRQEISEDSILNCSHLLPRPAGKKGFVVVKNGHFYFESGERARFWGTTVGYKAAYPIHKEARRVAHYLASHGINLVRLVPTRLYARGTHQIDPKKWDRLCYLINALKKRGLYVYLYSVAQVHYTQPEKFIHNRKKSKALAFFYKPFQIELKDFWRRTLTKINPYTNKALKDDPVLAFFVMMNEASLYNELIYHFDYLTKDQQEKITDIIHQYDPSIRSLRKKSPKLYRACFFIESKFYREMYTFLRTLLPKIPIAGTNISQNLSMVKASGVSTDFVSNHWYGPYARANEGIIDNDNILDNNVFDGNIGALNNIIGLRLEGKPFILGEWNIGFPVDFRHVGPLFVSAYACFQDFDAVDLFLYFNSMTTNNCRIPSTLISGCDPSRAGISPAASTIFHEKYIKPAKEKIILKVLPSILYMPNWTPIDLRGGLGFISYLHQFSSILEGSEGSARVWIPGSPDNAKLIADAEDNGYINFEAQKIFTDTNELEMDFKNGILKIDSPKAQGAIGNLYKKKNIKLSDVTIQNISDQSSLVVTSMDGKDIKRSHKLLITFVGDSMNRGDKYLVENYPDANERPKHYYFPSELGKSPTLIKPLSCILSVRRIDPSGGLNIYPLESNGERKKALTYTRMGNWYRFQLNTGRDKTIYYEIGQ